MFNNETIAYWWRSFVDLFAGLGLPWDKTTTAILVLAVAFYAVGAVFKALVQK